MKAAASFIPGFADALAVRAAEPLTVHEAELMFRADPSDAHFALLVAARLAEQAPPPALRADVHGRAAFLAQFATPARR